MSDEKGGEKSRMTSVLLEQLYRRQRLFIKMGKFGSSTCLADGDGLEG